jgi:signal transduction histidine kinase
VSSTPAPGSNSAPTAADLSHRRAELQRGLRRANFAWFIIVGVIGVLTVGIVWKAGQSVREAERANQNAARAEREAERANIEATRANAATARAEKELWNARFTEARAVRQAGGPNARVKSSHIVEELARTSGLSDGERLALRNETIAQLALADIEFPDSLATNGIPMEAVWDDRFERYAMGAGAGAVKIFDADSRAGLRSFPVPTGFIRESVHFSPDGRYLAALFRRNSSRVLAWRIDDGALVVSNATVSAGGYDRPFFSTDSRTLAIYAPRELKFFHLDSGTAFVRTNHLSNARFSPDSKRLVFTERRSVRVVSFPELGDVATVEMDFEPSVVAWHPDGIRIAIGGRKGELVMWDTARATGGLARLGGHSSTVVKLIFADRGSLLLSWAWDTFTSVWDTRTGRRLLADSRMAVMQYREESGEMILETGPARRRGKGRLHGPKGFRAALRTERIGIPAAGAAFSDDGRFAATDYIGFTRLWDAASGHELARVAGRSPVFLGDTNFLLTCSPVGVFRHDFSAWTNGGLGISEVREGFPLFRYQPKTGRDDSLNTISLSPDRRTVVVSACAEGVVLLDLAGQKPEQWLRDVHAHYASVSADGDWVLTQYHEGESYIVSAKDQRRRTRIGQGYNAAFAQDGQLFAAASSAKALVAQKQATNSWKKIAEAPAAQSVGANTQLAFSSDGRWLAMNTNRFEVHLFDPLTLRPLATFTPPSGSPIGGPSLAFSPDGRFLRVLLQDGELIEWDIPVVRTELAKLSIDWGDAATRVESRSFAVEQSDVPAVETNSAATLESDSASAAHITKTSSNVVVPAGIAALLAIGAGVFVFFHQRRTLAAYADAESLAAQQQEKLAQAQDALFQSRKMEALGTLAAGVAHDFNNLLSIIRMSNQLVKRAVKPDGVTKENVEAIEQAVQQGKTIVNSMLGYSRRPADVIEEFSAANVVGDTVGLLSRQFLSGLILNVQIDLDTPAIVGSATRLEQVMLNLIVNASEAMNGSGTLTVLGRRVADPKTALLQPAPAREYVELVVSDSGPGIPPAIIVRIFEPFFTTKTVGAQRGTGLGLSMVYAIARDEGWGLDVASVEGKGTTFRIVLPATHGEPTGRRLPTSQSGSASDSIPAGSL